MSRAYSKARYSVPPDKKRVASRVYLKASFKLDPETASRTYSNAQSNAQYKITPEKERVASRAYSKGGCGGRGGRRGRGGRVRWGRVRRYWEAASREKNFKSGGRLAYINYNINIITITLLSSIFICYPSLLSTTYLYLHKLL